MVRWRHRKKSIWARHLFWVSFSFLLLLLFLNFNLAGGWEEGEVLPLLDWKLEMGNSGLELPTKQCISQDADLNDTVLLVQNQIFPPLDSLPDLAFAASAPSLPNLPFSLPSVCVWTILHVGS